MLRGVIHQRTRRHGFRLLASELARRTSTSSRETDPFGVRNQQTDKAGTKK
jgi:hypothetical protein